MPTRAQRFLSGVAGASLAGTGCAVADAWRTTGGLPGARLVLGELGLFAPLVLALGVVAGAVRLLLLPAAWPRSTKSGTAPTDADAERVLGTVLSLSLAAVAGLFALVTLGRVALRLLASPEAARASGAALALSALGLAALVAFVALGLSPALAGFLRARSGGAPKPLAIAAGTLAVVSAAFGLLVAFGTTSGAGGPLALFGVLRREELNLWPSTLVLVMLLGGVVLPVATSTLVRALVFGAATLPFLVVPYAAGSAFDRKISLAVERSPSLGKLLLAGTRRLADRDGDGAAGLYGGGDCAEGDPERGPALEDVPGNGIDEDCSGSDAAPVAAKAPPPPRPVAASEWIRERLPKRPNLILISIDSLRFELGFMGYPRNVSPRLDALAKKSVVFEHFYALASYTSKSLAPMLIGRYCSETRRGFLHFNRFTKEETFVSERLQRAGIRTVSVQGHWYFFKPYGFERGYDVIDTEATPAEQPIEGDRSSNGDELSDRIIAQLERPELESQQFFLWSHYLDPHAEYVPHEQFDFGHRGRERYDGEVAFTDHHVGRVLDALERRPFADRTIVVITSDHGEAFGEHGLYRHGFELWEELVRVPLIVYVPGAEPRRVRVRRSAIDFVPTVLDLFGIEPPPPEDRGALRGESLLADVLNPPGYAPEQRAIYMDMPAGPYNDERQAYIEGDLKIITTGGRGLGLYNLADDPGEKRDLLDDKSLAGPMLEKTKAFRRALDEIYEKPK